MTRVEVNEFRPGRNFIRVGDTVRAHPKVGQSYAARVTRIVYLPDLDVFEIDVVATGRGPSGVRTFAPERIARKAQTKAAK